MNKRARTVVSVVSFFLVAALVTGLVLLLTKNKGTKGTTESTVSFGTLYSTISSSGLVSLQKFSTEIPLAAKLFEVEDIKDLEDASYENTWASVLTANPPKPIAYRVKDISDDVASKPLAVVDGSPNTELLTLVPVYFDAERVKEVYDATVAGGTTEPALTMLLYIMFEAPSSGVDISLIAEEFLLEKEEEKILIDTAFTNALMEKTVSSGTDLSYKISRVTYKEGDMLTLASDLFTVSYEETFVAYTVSEYDYAEIEARMRHGERVYAAVSVNALGGRIGLAEVVKMQTPTHANGVSYYTLLAKMVYAELTEELIESEEGEESEYQTVGDYTYYDSELTPAYIKGLGVPEDDFLLPEEVLTNFSVTVTSQKEAIHNTLILPTKCIFYDSANKPYVLKLDGEKKEQRVYIKVLMSTGIESAVAPEDGSSLQRGDTVKYLGDSSLLSSLF